MTTQDVYKRIAAVSAKMAQEGISKSRNNQQQGYRFRGIDDVYNALAPVLADNELVVLPRVLSRQCDERTSSSGKPIFYVTVEVEFDIVSASDGSKHTVKTYGEAMDSADKATNKAMSAAYKYAAMQTFCIPTEGDNDADAQTHEVAPKTRSAQNETGPEPDAMILAQFNAAKDVASLTKVMNSIPSQDRNLYTPIFQARMGELKKAA